MSKPNLAAYLAAALAQGICDHTVRVVISGATDSAVQFYIHPQSHDGETLDFVVRGNELDQIGVPKPSASELADLVPGTLVVCEAQERGLLERVKAWRDSEANDAFPHDLRAEIDAMLAPLPLLESGSYDEAAQELKIQATRPAAPRLKPGDIDAAIVGETYTVLPSGRVTVCEMTLRNGFTVRGESAVVSIENFDRAIGEQVARENARNKIWELEGYLLTERLHAAR